ncbi:MAG: hypothetical protein ACFCVK_03180 [Acidimicrobiales bacterium]
MTSNQFSSTAAGSPDSVPVVEPAPSLAALAWAAAPDRNRAVDFYRAAAMLAVAGGHWMAIAIGIGAAASIRQ